MKKRPNRLVLNDTRVFALTGGKGSRLHPLTKTCAKPILPFGARWVIIDLVLWSLYHSGFSNITAIIQYLGSEVSKHLRKSMPMRPDGECYIDIVSSEHLYGLPHFAGTADAVYQNLKHADHFDYSFIVSGDHVFLMDGRQVYEFHRANEADLTIMAHEVSVEEAREFGVIVVDDSGRIVEFQEKPTHPKEIPGKPGRAYASMGIYFFSNKALRAYVGDQEFRKRCMLKDPNDEFDFGKHVIPEMIRRKAKVMAYPFKENKVPDQPLDGEAYWEDVGTFGAYFNANMDLAGKAPKLNLYSEAWPILSSNDNFPPAKSAEPTTSEYSIIAGGCITNASTISYSLLSPCVRVQNAKLHRTIIFPDVHIGHGARVQNCIIDRGVVIPPGTVIGEDLELDRSRFHVDEASGLVIVTREMFTA